MYYSIMSLLRKQNKVIIPINSVSPLRKKVIKPIERYASKPAKWYARIVRLITEKNVKLLKGIERRQFRVCEVDHKISIAYGFKHNIAPYCIAHISNLRLVDSKTNTQKSINILVDASNRWIIE